MDKRLAALEWMTAHQNLVKIRVTYGPALV
jgi:hypothetical protein